MFVIYIDNSIDDDINYCYYDNYSGLYILQVLMEIMIYVLCC